MELADFFAIDRLSQHDEEMLIESAMQMQQMMMLHESGIREIKTKLDILSDESRISGKPSPDVYKRQGYISHAGKPFSRGFRKAANRLGLSMREIAVIGDQIFTDVFGGNRAGALTCYVETLDRRFFWINVRYQLELSLIHILILRSASHSRAPDLSSIGSAAATT